MIDSRDCKTLPLLNLVAPPVPSTPQKYLDRWAILSACGRYRCLLGRQLQREGAGVLFIMLNPSVADADKEDPTMRRCAGFARAWGHAFFEICNLYAWRSTDPKQLLSMPVEMRDGPDNREHLQRAAERAAVIVCAWGAHPAAQQKDPMAYLRSALPHVTRFWCLEKLSSGAPRHPLMAKQELTPIPFP